MPPWAFQKKQKFKKPGVGSNRFCFFDVLNNKDLRTLANHHQTIFKQLQ